MFRPENHDLRHWPPSPALTIAVLPFIRSAYNELYKYTFADLEKKWDQAVQRKPREGEAVGQIAEGAAVEANAIFGLELEFINDDEDDIVLPNLPPGNGERQVGPQAFHDPGFPELNQQPNQADPQPGLAPERRPQRQGWEIRQNVSTAYVASTVIGALFFPAISALMGDILKYALPSKWVTKGISGVSLKLGSKSLGKGMLQEKWGRSIIGGCLFVVLKDVVVLYCKWKKARDFGKKKIVDYVRR